MTNARAAALTASADLAQRAFESHRATCPSWLCEPSHLCRKASALFDRFEAAVDAEVRA